MRVFKKMLQLTAGFSKTANTSWRKSAVKTTRIMKNVRYLTNTTKTSSARLLSTPAKRVSKLEVAQQQHRMLHQRGPATFNPVMRSSASRTKANIPANRIGVMAAPSTRASSQLTTTRPEDKADYGNKAIVSEEPTIHSSFEERTGTWQYVVADPTTQKAVIIDSVLDYDAATQTISTSTADALLAMIAEKGYHIEKILETHAHADHLTAASYLQHRLSQLQGSKPPICIGQRIREVQKRFAERYGISADEYEGVFDHLFEDDETFSIGELTAKVMHLPGHTPDHIGYHIAGKPWYSMC